MDNKLRIYCCPNFIYMSFKIILPNNVYTFLCWLFSATWHLYLELIVLIFRRAMALIYLVFPSQRNLLA